MNFMSRNRQPLSILLAGAILTTITITPVSAEYNPRLGRFMQRDPNQTAMLLTTALVENGKAQAALAQLNAVGQYSDGLSLYQYQRSNPLILRDPSGEVIPLLLALLIGGAIAGALGKAGVMYATGQDIGMSSGQYWKNIGIGALIGALFGGIIFAGAPAAGALFGLSKVGGAGLLTGLLGAASFARGAVGLATADDDIDNALAWMDIAGGVLSLGGAYALTRGAAVPGRGIANPKKIFYTQNSIASHYVSV